MSMSAHTQRCTWSSRIHFKLMQHSKSSCLLWLITGFFDRL
uniref:Uncharacterized protein n=1 Tax=Anguilla anguilla TaxID=7936 RepID=A0A0E9TSL8_ANGAN